MALAFGKVLPLDAAIQLGVLQAAEGLTKDGPDKPWQVLTAADLPTEQSGAGADVGERESVETPMAKHNVSLYRAMHHLNKGGLHRALGVPEGTAIPSDKLEAAKHSSNPHVAHMANFAATMGGFSH